MKCIQNKIQMSIYSFMYLCIKMFLKIIEFIHVLIINTQVSNNIIELEQSKVADRLKANTKDQDLKQLQLQLEQADKKLNLITLQFTDSASSFAELEKERLNLLAVIEKRDNESILLNKDIKELQDSLNLAMVQCGEVMFLYYYC